MENKTPESLSNNTVLMESPKDEKVGPAGLTNVILDGDQRHEETIHRKLRKLYLDCWQREYGKRPYIHFIFHGKVFENRFHRKMNEDDFLVILTFLDKRIIKNVELIYSEVPDIHIECFLKCLSDLVNLNLSYTHVPLEFYKYLADNSENLMLKSLRLCGNEIEEAQSEYLRTYLMKTNKLCYFDVSNCNLNQAALATIADGITYCQTLKTLNLSNIVPCHPQQSVDALKISTILSIIIWKNPLMEVDFRNCSIDAFGIENIAEYVSHSTLRILNISGNNIGPDGTEALFKALRKSCLAALDISCNNIGSIGGSIISQNLEYTNLKYLDICYNGISAESMELILMNVTQSNQIKVFNMHGNEFNSAAGDLLNTLINDKILCGCGLDVKAVYDKYDDGYRVVAVENQLLSNYQKEIKMSRYCIKNDINPKTMLWFKKNIRHIVEDMDANFP